MKKVTNLKEFKETLPYASEIFGVYQPLLGWKSKRIEERIKRGVDSEKVAVVNKIYGRYKGRYVADVYHGEISSIQIGELSEPGKNFDTAIMREIAKALPSRDKIDKTFWKRVITRESLSEMLNTPVREDIIQWARSMELPEELERQNPPVSRAALFGERINRESVYAGILLDLVNNEQYDDLYQIFYAHNAILDLPLLLEMSKYKDPFDYFDPKKDIERVGLSPIGVVHLFRQYFFEFDTFLGTPVGHVWLSPGSTVELIEISTRKTITEKVLESQSESIVKSEISYTDQDEISDAVKQDNKDDVKFGASVTENENWVWGSASQTASFDMNTTQQTAREQSHKHMRQQSEKLSTEIRKNYKSTFKTTTEYTDTTSKRYVLVNGTKELINYELRRKMRQVGVQVQDIGTYLCWQTFVDEPGRDLGVASLLHVAKSPDLDQIPHPEEIVLQKPFTEKINLQIPFVPSGDEPSDQKDISFTNGRETHDDGWGDDIETIQDRFEKKVICERADYYLADVQLSPKGSEVSPSVTDFTVNKNSNEATFIVQLDYVHFHDQDFVNIEATLYWQPNQDLEAIKAKNKERLAEYTEKIEAEYKKAFVEAARERVKLASNIQPRKYEELREEERIVVYRKLIQDLLTSKIPQPDYRTRHVVSELINSIFDVDKMLYFVAPEWWKPRKHYGQSFGVLKPTGKITKGGQPEMKPDLTSIVSDENFVGWGGIDEVREDNYYITEDSLPAKLGSSLGWLLQLDGDNMRNAFLNAPWVKAVIPIRPGKEKAALNWLKQIEGANGITANDMYTGQEPELQGKSMLNVLDVLADKVQQKHMNAIKTSDIPDPDHPNAADNMVTATPVDKVYEHGFYPLQGGFKAKVDSDFEIFDQWIEVLPTDQVVAVEVKYDPKTGRQI